MLPLKSMMHRWNSISVDASGVDHTPLQPGENRVYGEQLGPCRAARAMAIAHLAMYDAISAAAAAGKDISMDAAIAQAAHDTLNSMFPSQSHHCDELLAEDLAGMPDSSSKRNGIEMGLKAASNILAQRRNDGSNHREPQLGVDYIASNDPGKWRQDPISRKNDALGARWMEVQPFVLDSADQFRIPPPPALTSRRYTAAYEEAKRLGGDGIITPTQRTADQTVAGTFWAYDGTPSLCAPPRLYNQIAMQIADVMGTSADPVELARLLAILNVAMADAGIAVWESKYYYSFWRPVTGIREADAGTGPSGLGDGNPNTLGDSNFSPLGAPASNLNGPNFTPPFPAYPSGHAGFGGALFQTLRRYYNTDTIPFAFVSDEFNGETRGNDGAARPKIVRNFSSLSEAEEENGQSRIYLGIHWSFDKIEGIYQGRRVADYVFDNAFPAR